VIYTSGDDIRGFAGDEDDGVVYDPQQVRLTTPDGRKMVFDRTQGLIQLEDLNGNRLDFSPSGVTSTTGAAITFVRDGLGRITKIVVPGGTDLDYLPNAAGDLDQFTDEAGNVTRFFYDSKHNLLEIRDPLGRRASRSEFDDAGRLVAVIDALGNRREITQDLGGKQTTILDRRGGVTILEYSTPTTRAATSSP
jgi:YD repeat-containing protein